MTLHANGRQRGFGRRVDRLVTRLGARRRARQSWHAADTANTFDLSIGHFPVSIDGRHAGCHVPGIKPSETFQYKFSVPQFGTYWYHSHSGLQEQVGHYGPIIIDPAGPDPVQYDREYVIVLSDWSFENPHRIFAKLKAMSDTYNYRQRTLPDFSMTRPRRAFPRLSANAACGAQCACHRATSPMSAARPIHI